MSRNIVVPNEEFFDNIVDEMRVTGRVKLLVRGGSMFPFFRDSVDTVVLRALDENEPLHCGEIYLFKSNGRYILHRLVGIKREHCAGTELEHPVGIEREAKRECTAGVEQDRSVGIKRETKSEGLKYVFRGDGNPKGSETAARDMVFAVAEKRIAPSGEEWSCNSKSWKFLSALWPKDYLFRRFIAGVLRRLSR